MPITQTQNSKLKVQNHSSRFGEAGSLKRKAFLFLFLSVVFHFSLFTFRLSVVNAQEPRSCDLCAWCGTSVSEKPKEWETCMKCLFPTKAATITPGVKPVLEEANPYYPSHPEVAKNWTVVGCLDTMPGGFVSQIYRLIIAIGSGFAFLAFVFGGFRVLTAAGDPQLVKSGKNIIVGAFFGLLLILFSVFLLKLIGYDIIKIPGIG